MGLCKSIIYGYYFQIILGENHENIKRNERRTHCIRNPSCCGIESSCIYASLFLKKLIF